MEAIHSFPHRLPRRGGFFAGFTVNKNKYHKQNNHVAWNGTIVGTNLKSKQKILFCNFQRKRPREMGPGNFSSFPDIKGGNPWKTDVGPGNQKGFPIFNKTMYSRQFLIL
jgi:hypothetical protein